jgi:hypothetical protein
MFFPPSFEFMVRIRLVWYRKRYLTKNCYLCRRYLLYLPVAIGDAVDTSLEYDARLFGPAIVITPKGCENFFSRLEKLEKPHRENTTKTAPRQTTSLQESSMTTNDDNLPSGLSRREKEMR